MDPNHTIPSAAPADSIDFNKLLIIVRNNWLWIATVFVVVNATAYLFIRYTKNVYESESELKLDIKKDASELGINTMIEDQNLNIVSGEIEMIQSKLFLTRVVENSNFEVSFFSVGHVLNEELFHNSPAFVSGVNKGHSYYNVPIRFEEIDTQQFTLSADDGRSVTGRYGESIAFGDLQVTLLRNDRFRKGDEIGYFFLINSRDVLLDYLSKNLTAEPLNFNANTIRLAFRDNNPFKAQAVLNKIDTLYLQYSNELKNQANRQKIDWLTNELSQIEKKMEDYENYFENFTLRNKSNDLDVDLKATIAAINRIDSQRYEYTRRLNDLDELIAGFKANALLHSFSLRRHLPEPLNKQIDDLQQLQLHQDKLKLSYQEVTFAYRQKQKEIEALKMKTLAQLGDLRTEWRKNLDELNKRKANLETNFATLPDKNTEFTKNQRFYKLYEEFYLLLMQSKSEFEIAQAGSTPDFKILSPASLTIQPIAPNKLMVAGVGAVASLMFALFLVGILYLANNKITNLNELEKLVSAPLLGAVPLSKYTSDGLHVVDHPKSMVSEAIRTLRTNLDFFSVASDKKVVAISSTVSGEGKSFIAMNLGAVVAMSKKKVVLIDLDMRKTKTALPVRHAGSSKGISTILIRRNSWQECVLQTPMENFDYIPAGPHPPNPSELLLNGEFDELVSDLKRSYDFVLLDTPPVGLVTDGIMAMKRADVSIYVFRANYSKKDFLLNLKRIVNINRVTNITTVLNAVPSSGKTYGYGYYEDNGGPRKLK